ncbi:hypothetical protein QUN99_003323 [Vibrio parahaemolyticus]|nr:hypothetical protein [Vibrio parahaemolyticus]
MTTIDTFSEGQSVQVIEGVRSGKLGIILEIMDSGYYYVHVDTHIKGRRVKVVYHARQLRGTNS